MDIDSVIASSASPVFVTDEQWRVACLNAAAESLLGMKSGEARGKACHELLCGVDSFGNRFCHGSCTVGTMAGSREPIRNFEMELETAHKTKLRVGFSILVLPGPEPGRYWIVHVMTPDRPSSLHVIETSAHTWSGPKPADPHGLTSRELSVLRHLCEGQSRQEIADTLGISLSTVSNHFQRIFRKLSVHSQIEAMAMARRRRLA